MATTRIPPDFKEFLRLLEAHGARFLLIGGYAVNAFGYVRNTIDIDVWIAPGTENERRVIEAIRVFAFPHAPDNLFGEEDAMVRMGAPPLQIEVLKVISGVEFEECWPRRVTVTDGDWEFPMIGLEDLKRNKRASGRPKDLLDLAELP